MLGVLDGRKQILILYRKILRLHNSAIPKEQLRDANFGIKSLFREQALRISVLHSDFARSEQTKILFENAQQYLLRVSSLSQHGKLPLQISSPAFWDQYYAKVGDDLLRKCETESNNQSSLDKQLISDETVNREWYCSYSVLKPYVPFANMSVDKKCTVVVLILGNGLSDLPFDLLEDGFRNITVVDVSAHANEIMELRFVERFGVRASSCNVQFVTLDAQLLDQMWKNESFDLVIDKGMLDALYLDSDSGSTKVINMQRQISKLLKPNGTWFLVSAYMYLRNRYTEQEENVPDESVLNHRVLEKSAHLKIRYAWSPQTHYVYLLRKTVATRSIKPKSPLQRAIHKYEKKLKK